MLYGVLFTQLIDNSSIGILLFEKQGKAQMAYRVLKGLEDLSSLDTGVNTILETADYAEVPEIEEEDVSAFMQLQVEGKNKMVTVINVDDIPDIE